MYFFYFLFLLFPAIINSEIRQHYFGVSQYIASGNCSTYREQFANYSALFMLCAVESSRPIKLCKNCVESYIHVIESYQNMSKVIVNDSTCLDVYNNHDRLRIVETIYSNTEALWSNAKCYECFLIVNNTQTNIISNVTNKFEDYYQDFTNCVSRTRTDDPCSLCMENYNILNNYFTGISNINEKISYCMDIVDIMNDTWTFWSTHCCKYRRHNEYIFLGISIGLILLTTVFYILSQFSDAKKAPMIIQQRRFAESINSLRNQILH